LEQEKEMQNVTLRGLCVERGLDKGGGGEGSGGIVRHLLGSLDDESEGKAI
jgi:hypothetical protein